MPSISFVTTIYNQADTLGMAIESILPLIEHYDSEFIFVNNGSDDGSVEIMNRYQKKYNLKVKYFDIPFGKIPLWEGRLFSFKQCSNDWIFVLDGDHIFEDEILKFAKEYIRILKPVTYLIKLRRLEGFQNGLPLYGGELAFHPIVYRNSRDWIEELRLRKSDNLQTEMGLRKNVEIPIDLPKSLYNKTKRISGFCVFDVGSSIKLRALRKWYWWYWQKLDKRHKEVSLDDYIKEKTNLADLNKIAEEHWEQKIRGGNRAIWDEKKYGVLPTPIRNRIGKQWNQKILSWEKIDET